ncbi:U6 snRNA-associated Sm-like protein LSm6 [Rasamsonia emersonii CBS 393.64]|uniref:U6 snRNA-associated Sm-like protein LSm6 n=1 Tax=Rasamsonia emersonii (strain ATCC 16479 / CBS 393.64 / IMI 116815) TaxID=1408163 RepID=A0A0F4YV25_RASE3|nr:U6 snRNA-associated Sm-like protein LSm6 [Rasamsonia emersonii CBS 393.64]KKA21681.1 U6 snRNA-associated Sm-like protein LSm6 [Rasamsonia emersonii CBS 393.64]
MGLLAGCGSQERTSTYSKLNFNLLTDYTKPFLFPISISNRRYNLVKPLMENGASSEGKDPSAFLSEIIGAPVTVKLNSGVVYKGQRSDFALGELQSVDGYMNIALEKTEEYVNGRLRRNYGDAFVRGNNVLYISAS